MQLANTLLTLISFAKLGLTRLDPSLTEALAVKFSVLPSCVAGTVELHTYVDDRAHNLQQRVCQKAAVAELEHLGTFLAVEDPVKTGRLPATASRGSH